VTTSKRKERDPVSEWTSEELRSIGAAEEIGIASRRRDGTIRPFVTIWSVREGDDIYIRSAYGSDNPWYRRAVASGVGRIRAGGVEHDVAFAPADPAVYERVDAAYHEKYDSHGPRIVATVVGAHAHEVTLLVTPDVRGSRK
jgi:hypothetical protein